MVPQNKLKAQMLKRLYIFAEEVHTYGEKFGVKKAEVKTEEVAE